MTASVSKIPKNKEGLQICVSPTTAGPLNPDI